MSETKTDPRVIFCRTAEFHTSDRVYPELDRGHVSMMVSMLYRDVMEAGYVPTEPPLHLPPQFFKRVREEHHEHGWQTSLVECPESEADIRRLSVEVPTVLAGESGGSRKTLAEAQAEAWTLGHIAGCSVWLFCDHRSPYA